MTASFPPALPHGGLTEVFPDVFFVTGTMRGEFFGAMWQFSRNMTVVRDDRGLTLINSVRLNEQGLEQLDKLGTVEHVIRIGDMHGIDDPFYVARYGATFWALPDMQIQDNLRIGKTLSEGGKTPVEGGSVFQFKTTRRPEAILRLERSGGILIACDSLQNWVAPDEFFLEETAATMRDMGFFAPANLGPAWMQDFQPQAEDFARLKKLSFAHVLCGHGTPVVETAKEAFHGTFRRVFGD